MTEGTEAVMAMPSDPYYSTDLTEPRVYHVFADCPNGEQIDLDNWASGTGGLPKCGTCINMGG
jgi:hypothetical protein